LKNKIGNCQTVVKKVFKQLSKTCQKLVKIGDNCISIKCRWGWRGGSKSDSTAFGRLPWSLAVEDETRGRRRRRKRRRR
jgi:hypothetical protein